MIQLPEEIQVEILGVLDLETLKNVCRTNKHFNKLCSRDPVWQFRVKDKINDTKSWRQLYIEQYRYEPIAPFIELLGLEKFIFVFTSHFIRWVDPGFCSITFPTEYKKRSDIINKIAPTVIDILIEDGKLDATKIIASSEIFEMLKKPTFLNRFLHAPIPQLHYTTVSHNYFGLRSYQIPQEDISIHDLLMAIMKTDFNPQMYEIFGVKLDLHSQTLSLIVGREFTISNQIYQGAFSMGGIQPVLPGPNVHYTVKNHNKLKIRKNNFSSSYKNYVCATKSTTKRTTLQIKFHPSRLSR